MRKLVSGIPSTVLLPAISKVPNAPLIIRVSEREWPSSPSPAFGGRKHLDIAQAFAHLLRFPHDRLKIRATENPRRKQHTIHIYAERRGLKVTTMTAGEWIYLKMYNPETDWRSGPPGHRRPAPGATASLAGVGGPRFRPVLAKRGEPVNVSFVVAKACVPLAGAISTVNSVSPQEWGRAKRSVGP